MLIIITGGLLTAKVLYSLSIMWQIFNFPFQLDDSEGMIVVEVGMMTKGVDLFVPPTPDVFISAPYTPLYYLFNQPFFQLGGMSFKPGRAISFLAVIAIGFFIYKLARLTSTKPLRDIGAIATLDNSDKNTTIIGAIIAVLIWASLGLVAFWGVMVKPDMTALAFSIAGVYFATCYITIANTAKKLDDKIAASLFGRILAHLQNERWVYLSALVLALAALTKQTAFAAPVAVGFCLIIYRPKAGLRFGVAYLVIAGLPMLAMQVLSNGGFWWHIVTVHELPWSFGNYWYFFSDFLRSYPLFVVLALLFLGIWLVQALQFLFGKAPKGFWGQLSLLAGNPVTLTAAYLVTAFGVGLSAGTYGGNHNHFLELGAAISWCSGLVLIRLMTIKINWLKWAYPLVLVLMWVQVLGMLVGEARLKPADFPVLGSFAPTRAALDGLRSWYYDEEWLGLQYRTPPANLQQGYTNASYNINNAQGLVYSDNVSLMINSQKPFFTTDPYTQTHATYFKRWDERKLVQMVQDKQFSLIVLREAIEDRLKSGRPVEDIYLSPDLAQAILDNYRLKVRDRAFEYIPK